jgi:probable F420-dependent oxidoreductase
VKFGLTSVNAGPFGFPEMFEVLVRTAEEVGFDSIWTLEHVVVPVGYQTRYPFSKDGKMPGPENVPVEDPLLPLSYAAAITTKLRLGTAIVILPQWHPLYVAKALATLDVLSRGRAVLGVGIGWLREEFAAVGVPFARRAARTEESIRAIRSLWKEKPEPFEGEFYRWAPVESNPKPVQSSGVPIVMGGHAEGPARRAARIADGFFPMYGELEQLASWIAALRDECSRIGRDPAEVEITSGMIPPNPDLVERYAELGVSRLAVPPPAFDPEGIRRGLHEFAERFIARF